MISRWGMKSPLPLWLEGEGARCAGMTGGASHECISVRMEIEMVAAGRRQSASSMLRSETLRSGMGDPFLNHLQRDEVTPPDSGTIPPRLLPGVGRFDVSGPEWPCSALQWSDGINRAASAVRVKIDAIPVAVFVQGDFPSGGASMKQSDLPNRLVQIVSDGADFLIGDPDISRRSGAAVSALRAFKSKSIRVPGRIRHL